MKKRKNLSQRIYFESENIAMTINNLIPIDYGVLLNDIKQRIRSAQYEALKTVNKELIALYWDIGKIIVERQKEENGVNRW